MHASKVVASGSPAGPRSYPGRLAQPFVTGLLAFLPLALTLIVLSWVVVLLHDLVGPASPFGKALRTVGLSFVACEVIAYMIGLAGTLVTIYAVGVLAERRIGLRYQRAMETALANLPLVSTVYDASKQLTSMLDRTNEDAKSMTPVMCRFGGPGSAATPALMPTPETVHIEGHDYKIVIIPTAPVPFGGALFCVPVDQVTPAPCSFEGMVHVFMSLGASAPEHLGSPPTSATPRGA